MKKIIKLITVTVLLLSTFLAKPTFFITDIVADEFKQDSIYYDGFDTDEKAWKMLQNTINTSVKDGKLTLTNKGDSFMINDNDQIRNNGDVAVKYTYNSSLKCFGFVIRGNSNPVSYQNVVYNYNSNTWLLGHSGNWVSIKAPKVMKYVAGQEYNMVARYEGSHLTIYVNGEVMFDQIVDELKGKGPVNGSAEGKAGIRMYCGDQSVEIDSFVSGPLNSIPNEGFPELGKDLTYNDFSKESDSLKDIVGSFSKKVEGGKLKLRNTSTEAILYDSKDKVRKMGDIEMDFNYKSGVRCFGPTFRSGTGAGQWQTVAYQVSAKGEASWVVGHPSGYWNSKVYPATPLEANKDYKMLVRYKDASIQVYLNGELVLDDAEVLTAKGPINPNDTEGGVGFRKYCASEDFEIDRLISADYGVIPNEGMSNMVIAGADTTDPVEPEPPVDPEENRVYYQNMRKMWKEQKVGNFTQSDFNDAQIQKHISNVIDDAQVLLDTIKDKANWNSEGVWAKKSNNTISANITTQFININKLAKVYATKSPENPYYQNAEILATIEDALHFLTQEGWFDGVKVTGNWWDFQVGIPQEMIDILIILHDDLPKASVLKYANIVNKYIPDASKQVVGAGQGTYIDIRFATTTSGANRTDLALTYLATGMLLEKESIVKEIVPTIAGVHKIVTKGDGFYSDGSFIQHGNIPYTGSYGNVLIKGVGKILSLLEDTPWQMDEKDIESFSKLVYDSFVPVTYKGETMPMVGGRSISRAPGARKQSFGSATIYNLLIASNFASEPYKTQLKEAAKYWILEDQSEYYFNNNRDLRDLLEVKAVLKDASVSGTTVPFKGSKMFPSMDRFVHTSDHFSLGISMYSSRISAFEAGNSEHKKGWFTSDGMTYLQNQDKMFGESYWPTVDWYRLPGTTVDTRPLKDEGASFRSQTSPQSYVGGASDGTNSAVAMVLNKAGFKNNSEVVGYDLKAFKSWFTSDDVIYALGAGINGNSTDGGAIETIIENRLLDPKMEYTLRSNLDFENNSTLKVKKGDWFILEAKDSKNNIAYVFYADHNIKLVKEENTGKYLDINGSFVNNKEYTESYQKIIIEHGTSVVDGSYAYALLPGYTEAMINEHLNSDVEIVSNTQDQQIVRVGGVTLSNTFPDAGGVVGDLKITGGASVVMVETDTTIDVFVADPKQKDSKFDFVLNRDRVQIGDGEVSIGTPLSFSVDNTGTLGKTSVVNIKKLANLETLNEEIKTFNELKAGSMTPYSFAQYSILLDEIKAILEDPKASQKDVDKLVEKLSEFINNFDTVIDFSYVTITFDYILDLDEDLHTVESWKLMLDAKAVLQQLMDDYNPETELSTDQSAVDEALKTLHTAINSLEVVKGEEPSADASVLLSQLDLISKLDRQDYKSEDEKLILQKLDALLETVNQYLEENTVYSQSVIDEFVESIDDLLESLQVAHTNAGNEPGDGGGSGNGNGNGGNGSGNGNGGGNGNTGGSKDDSLGVNLGIGFNYTSYITAGLLVCLGALLVKRSHRRKNEL